jgi:hypothetical protein
VNRFGGVWWFVAGALFAVSVGGAVMWWRARRPAAAALAMMVPAGSAVALVSALEIRGGVSPYLFSPDLAVGLVAWVVVGMAVAQVASRWSRRPTLTIAVVGTVAVALTGLVLVIGADAFDRVDTAQASDTAVALRPAVQEVCASNRPVNVASLDVQWYDTLAVAAAIGECAPDVKVDPGLAFIAGARRTERSPGLPVLLSATTTPAPKGWELVGRTQVVSLYVHDRAALH